MSYDENRISDLIDGGLKQQQESIKIDYALYRKITDEIPLIRFNNLKDAKEEFIKSSDYTMIICEVSELINGKRIIMQERVLKAPQIWLPADRFIPEFDDDFLCYLVREEECGNIVKWQEVLRFEKLEWQKRSDTCVTHWMIVEDPILGADFKKALEKKIKTEKGSTKDEFST